MEKEPKRSNLEMPSGDSLMSLAASDFRAIVENSFEGVIVTDQEGTIIYVNPAWQKASGWSFDEVVDKVTPRIVKSGKQDVEFYKTMWGAIKSGKLFRAEIINKAKDGSYYNAEISIFPIKTEQGSIFIEVSRNITELKKAQAEIGAIQAREKQELERLVAERTQELQEKIEEVEKLNKYMLGRELKMTELKKEIESLKRINKIEEE